MSRIAFFGTPEFGAHIFEGLISYCKQKGHTTLFAVCQPDRPKGRGQNVVAPPVKIIATKHDIPVLQPTTLRSGTEEGDSFFEFFKTSSIDLAVVVAYGLLIPKRLLPVPRCGFINVHPSLLPRWRGATPIQRALLAGDKKTGVCIMDLTPEMDAGDVYLMHETPIFEEENALTLSQRTSELGLQALLESLDPILDGSLKKKPQASEGLTFAPKLTKQDGSIPWEKSASDIINHSRAMAVWPQSFSYYHGRPVKLFGAHLPKHATSSGDVAPGTIVSLEAELIVKCLDGSVAFDGVQFEGKSLQSALDATNGKLLRVLEHFSTEAAQI